MTDKTRISEARIAIPAGLNEACRYASEVSFARRIMIRRALWKLTLATAVAAVAPSAAASAASQQQDGTVDRSPTFSQQEVRRIRQQSPLPPPPGDPTNQYADNPAAARFGQLLFFDTRLSGDNDVACASCHDSARGFADGLSRRWQNMRHTQSLWNVAYSRWLFWDGRRDSLWAQAIAEIEQPLEFAGSRLQVVHALQTHEDLRGAYEAIFGELPDVSDTRRFPPTGRPMPDQPDDPMHERWMSVAAADQTAINRMMANIGKAIAAYERTLISRRAPFDVFVEGLAAHDPEVMRAISSAAQRGLKLFVGRANCRLCHGGPNFSDGEFHNNGAPPLSGGQPRDAARYDGARLLLSDPFNALGMYSDDRTGAAADRLTYLAVNSASWGQFKTPSLRNIAGTGPYMHQGQLKTLHDVVEFYSTLKDATAIGHHQETILQPLNLTEDEIVDLVEFLQTLTDERIDPTLLGPP